MMLRQFAIKVNLLIFSLTRLETKTNKGKQKAAGNKNTKIKEIIIKGKKTIFIIDTAAFSSHLVITLPIVLLHICFA